MTVGAIADGSTERETYMLGGSSDGNIVSIRYMPELLRSVECDITLDGKRYFDLGALFVELCDGNFDDAHMADVYEKYRDEYDFPRGFACVLTSDALGTSYALDVNGFFMGDDDALIADDALYGEIYRLLGGEFDALIVKNSPAVKKFISRGKHGLRLDNTAVRAVDDRADTIDGIKKASGAIAGIFAVFSATLLLNFLLQSFSDKLRTLGILKANGCGSGGLAKVLATESVAAGLVALVLSCAITPIVGTILNAHFGIAFFGAYHAALPVTALTLVVVVCLACIVPAVKTSRMTAMRAIRAI